MPRILYAMAALASIPGVSLYDSRRRGGNESGHRRAQLVREYDRCADQRLAAVPLRLGDKFKISCTLTPEQVRQPWVSACHRGALTVRRTRQWSGLAHCMCSYTRCTQKRLRKSSIRYVVRTRRSNNTNGRTRRANTTLTRRRGCTRDIECCAR